jgi:hypothetical protein
MSADLPPLSLVNEFCTPCPDLPQDTKFASSSDITYPISQEDTFSNIPFEVFDANLPFSIVLDESNTSNIAWQFLPDLDWINEPDNRYPDLFTAPTSLGSAAAYSTPGYTTSSVVITPVPLMPCQSSRMNDELELSGPLPTHLPFSPPLSDLSPCQWEHQTPDKTDYTNDLDPFTSPSHNVALTNIIADPPSSSVATDCSAPHPDWLHSTGVENGSHQYMGRDVSSELVNTNTVFSPTFLESDMEQQPSDHTNIPSTPDSARLDSTQQPAPCNVLFKLTDNNHPLSSVPAEFVMPTALKADNEPGTQNLPGHSLSICQHLPTRPQHKDTMH